jgi:hypothetical protein
VGVKAGGGRRTGRVEVLAGERGTGESKEEIRVLVDCTFLHYVTVSTLNDL